MAWLAGTLTYAKTRKRRRRRTWTDEDNAREGGKRTMTFGWRDVEFQFW